jgi:hypothetical protein
MALQRQQFNISAAASAVGDTGVNFTGAIRQIAWAPTTADTGGDLYIALLPVDTTDTAGGVALLNDADCLGASFIRAITVPGVSADGFDTGVDLAFNPVAAGDRLRVKVTPGGAACVGRLYVWTSDAN